MVADTFLEKGFPKRTVLNIPKFRIQKYIKDTALPFFVKCFLWLVKK